MGVVWNLPLSIQGVYSQFCEFLRKFARLNQPKGGVYKPQDEALLTAYDSLTPHEREILLLVSKSRSWSASSISAYVSCVAKTWLKVIPCPLRRWLARSSVWAGICSA